MKIKHYLLFMLLMTATGIVQTKPFVPQDDHLILQRLPEELFESATNTRIKILRTQVKNNPQDWTSASQLSQHYIDLAQTHADPRYMGYAKALLTPWWQTPQPSIQALILRAIIRQNAHNFKGANADLEQVLSVQPGHVQANLIKATIATVQGDYQIAIKHCGQLMRRSSINLALICQSTPASLSGKAENSYRLLNQVLSAATPMPDKEKVWAWTSLAEIAWRLGKFEAADQHFQIALHINAKDMYLQRTYADFLLQQQRPNDVIQLIKGDTQVDSMLLRLALAEQMTNSAQLNQHIVDLQNRFKANRSRGSTLHQGDEARFNLQLLHQPQSALQLARQNWQIQRESVDTYILLQSAIAANDLETLANIEHWLTKQRTEDVLINQMLVTQELKHDQI